MNMLVMRLGISNSGHGWYIAYSWFAVCSRVFGQEALIEAIVPFHHCRHDLMMCGFSPLYYMFDMDRPMARLKMFRFRMPIPGQPHMSQIILEPLTWSSRKLHRDVESYTMLVTGRVHLVLVQQHIEYRDASSS